LYEKKPFFLAKNFSGIPVKLKWMDNCHFGSTQNPELTLLRFTGSAAA